MYIHSYKDTYIHSLKDTRIHTLIQGYKDTNTNKYEKEGGRERDERRVVVVGGC